MSIFKVLADDWPMSTLIPPPEAAIVEPEPEPEPEPTPRRRIRFGPRKTA